MIGPRTGGESLELGTRVLIVGQLRLPHKLFHAPRGAVAALQRQLYIGQEGSLVNGSGMHEPGVVDRPQLVGRNELLETLEGWNVLIVALLRTSPASGRIFSTEPIRGRPPTVRTFHVDAIPQMLPVRILGK